MVDIICFLCKQENLSSPAAALRSPISILLADDHDKSSLVLHLQPNARFIHYSIKKILSCFLCASVSL
jgi:hypothetical protein